MGFWAELIPFGPQMIRLQPDNFGIWPLPIPIMTNLCGASIPIGPAQSKLRFQAVRQRKSSVARRMGAIRQSTETTPNLAGNLGGVTCLSVSDQRARQEMLPLLFHEVRP